MTRDVRNLARFVPPDRDITTTSAVWVVIQVLSKETFQDVLV
jgi:hypothetical protein